MGEIYAKIFLAVHVPFFQKLTYRSDPSADFCARWLKRRGLAQGCAFWGLKNLKLIFNAVFFNQGSAEPRVPRASAKGSTAGQ